MLNSSSRPCVLSIDQQIYYFFIVQMYLVKKINDDLFELLLYQGKHKGRKKKINLRQSPFHIQDGDIIGVKVTDAFLRKVCVNRVPEGAAKPRAVKRNTAGFNSMRPSTLIIVI